MIGLGEDSDFPGNTTSEEFDLTCAYRNDSKALHPGAATKIRVLTTEACFSN